MILATILAILATILAILAIILAILAIILAIQNGINHEWRKCAERNEDEKLSV